MKIIVSALFVLFIVGCNLISQQPFIRTTYFDLGSSTPQIETRNWDLDILNFKTTGPYQKRMAFRSAPTVLEFDEFNRWSMPPAEMLRRYFLIAFNSEDGMLANVNEEYTLRGVLVQLEADLKSNMVNIIFHVSVVETESGKTILSRTFHDHIPVAKITGASFAAATKIAVDKMILKIAPKIPKLTTP